jgi:uncharacterized protein YdhG (YjbR/CyaY superfamily)
LVVDRSPIKKKLHAVLICAGGSGNKYKYINMVSDATTVTDYLKESPKERKPALTRLRKLCKEILAGYEEGMAYGGPTYKKDKGIEIGFGNQKHYIGFYCLVHEVMLDNKDLLKGFNHGKGVIRFSNPDKIDFELIKKILTDTVNSGKKPC